jgi:hypothetical protein
LVKKENKKEKEVDELIIGDWEYYEEDEDNGNFWNSFFMILMMIIMIPFIILGIILVSLFTGFMILFNRNWGKCKHWKECESFNPEDETCTKMEGMYYDYNHPAGCYYKIQDRKDKLKKQGKTLKRLR